jgi:type II secretory pathway predicted ATPase ExeA
MMGLVAGRALTSPGGTCRRVHVCGAFRLISPAIRHRIVYEDYYRFARPPFSLTPDPEFLYRSGSHQAALEQLLRGIRRREGIFLLTGDVGTGKTTIYRTLVDQLGAQVFTALVLNPFVTQKELLRVILQDFGLITRSEARTGTFARVTKQQLIETLNDFLVSLAQIDASAIVIIDEAQNLSPPVLEFIRILTGLETGDRKLLQILLVGQLELAPLTRDEVAHYIAFRLRIASGTWAGLFDERVVDLVYEFSGAVPRKINLICNRSLEAGFTALAPTINADIVARAAEMLRFHWETTAPPRLAAEPGGGPRVASRFRGWMAAGVGAAAGVAIGALLVMSPASWLDSGAPTLPMPPHVRSQWRLRHRSISCRRSSTPPRRRLRTAVSS